MLSVMQFTLTLQAQKAVEAALKGDWRSAVEINRQILEKDPGNIDAKTRMGRAYVQTRQFDKAKKIFREVLKADPINLVARKNLEIATKGRLESRTNIAIDTRNLLKEPGTTREIDLQIEIKGITANDFLAGENLDLKLKKKSIDVYKHKKDETLCIGSITNEELVNKLQEASPTAVYVSGKEKSIRILLKACRPVFKAERQEIRPYIKKGGIDEPESENEEVEEIIEE